jgi:signal peptidase II
LSPAKPGSKSKFSYILEGGALSIGLALLIAILDQLTKQWATSALGANPDGGPSLLGGWVTLTYTTNTGAAFGVLADRSILFVLIGLVLVAVVIAYWRFLPGKRLLLRVSLGLQLGGAAGNVLDRLREGHVIDFVQVHDLPVFNLADSCIVIGVLLLMAHLLLSPASPRSGRPPSPFGSPESSQPDSGRV